ncbi:MAG: secretion protein HlyD [Gammaproteobacteria bacterium]|nr:secretion protein HlyD [Gammaproteobacteria bacterium]
MKKRIVILLVLIAGGFAAYTFWPRGSGHDRLTLYGNVDIREVQLGFRVAGRLEQMNFEEGDAVAAGTVLAKLDSKPLRDGLALAEAGMAEAEARLAVLRSGSRPQEIQQARAQVSEAGAALKNAEQEYVRQRELTGKGLSSQGLLDNALAQRDEASARLAAARQALALAIEGPRAEDITAAEAALAGAMARREQASTQLQDTELLAPNNGVVLTRVREPGAIVSAGMPVYTLSLTDTVYVRAYVDESNLGQVVPGAKLIVTTDSSAKEYMGQVGFVSPRAEFTPKSVETPELRTDLVYRLRIVIQDADDGLRQGMPVTVTVPSA